VAHSCHTAMPVVGLSSRRSQWTHLYAHTFPLNG